MMADNSAVSCSRRWRCRLDQSVTGGKDPLKIIFAGLDRRQYLGVGCCDGIQFRVTSKFTLSPPCLKASNEANMSCLILVTSSPAESSARALIQCVGDLRHSMWAKGDTLQGADPAVGRDTGGEHGQTAK